MDVYCSPKETIEDIWQEVAHYFQRALDKHDAEYTLDDLKKLILDGSWKLFVFVNNDKINGAAVVSFITYPRSHTAFVTCIGGNQLVTEEYYKKFMVLLKEYGATKVQGYVTASIERLYRKLGIARKTTMVEIPL
jgi:hypothetical protein